jgi:hypothetical protein
LGDVLPGRCIYCRGIRPPDPSVSMRPPENNLYAAALVTNASNHAMERTADRCMLHS